MATKEEAIVLPFGDREVRVTHPSKPYFSKGVQLTKLDIVRYYQAVAAGALRGIADRPLVLKRFVDGGLSCRPGESSPDRSGDPRGLTPFAAVCLRQSSCRLSGRPMPNFPELYSTG